MKNLIGQKFNRLLVLEKTSQREGGSIIWKCKCDCGNECYASTRGLCSGNKKSCGCLNNEKRIERIKKYNDEHNPYYAGLKINELTLIEPTEYKDCRRIIWKCQCSCGKICYVNTSNLKNQKSCGHLNNFYYLDISNQKFGKLTAIEPTFFRQNGSVVWRCKCDCGNETFKGSSYLTSGAVQSCGCLKSKGEQKIISILQQNNIDFLQQKKFDTCKINNHYLYFDFYINNKYLIEYDGIQHFEQTGWEDLSIIQERDNYKNQWCKKNNIPLIRIPYTHLEELCFEDLLLETSNFILK